MSEVIDMPSAGPARDMRRRAVRVRAGSLRAALKDALGAVTGRGEIPILSHVVLTAGDGAISLEATDLDIWVERSLASNDRDGPGGQEWAAQTRGLSVALPARPLDKILAGIDADAMATIALETDDGAPDDLTDGYSGYVTVSAGRARFRLACLPPSEFPRVTLGDYELSFEIGCGVLADALARVSHAVSSEETRYYLNGVLLHVWQEPGVRAELRFVATDGSRLARLAFPAVPDGAMALPATIVHRRTVALLDKLLASAAKTGGENEQAPEVLIERDGDSAGGLMRFTMPAPDGGEVTVTAKSIDGTFPDYPRVIPGDPARKVRAPRAALAEALRRVAALTEDKTRAVKLSLAAGSITLGATVPGLGSAEESVDLSGVPDESGEGAPGFAVGVNADILRTALGVIAADDVELGFHQEASGPIRIEAFASDGEPVGLLQVVMPVRI